MFVQGKTYRSVWIEGGVVRMVDQRLLPHRFEILECPSYRDTAEAIKTMAIRGAGAIGAAAGYAMAQAALEAPETGSAQFIEEAAQAIRATRPTAHDLFYAVEHVRDEILHADGRTQAREQAVRVAIALADENAKAGERIGQAGLSLLKPGIQVLTHCNTGWLAFADWGSALAPIYQAHRQGMQPFVYVTQTMPRAQGAKLTAWELGQEGVAHAVIADTAAGFYLQQGVIDCVIVGADRIAANGDVANKIGTYQLAVLAQHHQVPFYVAAPRSTFDLSTPNGSAIQIEEREPEEVTCISGETPEGTIARVRITPHNSSAKNPAFDRTPAALVKQFITEAGLLDPLPQAIAQFVRGEQAVVRG